MPPNFYNENAKALANQYLSKTFEQVHKSWSHFLPVIIENPNARILVYAVEPAVELTNIGKQNTQNLNVKWLEDSLPALTNTSKLEVSFDLILLSAVWMHIPPSDRARSIRKLANLLKPGGKLVISLRHGQTEDDYQTRKMFDVCTDELKQLATDVGLFTKFETPKETDELGRNHIHWQTVVLQLPDDGTGAFPFIRHVAINDGKSATHKLGLLRVLLRIADGHPGAVLRREASPFGDRVILPAGLVALYWCHQYKDLIDSHKLYQTPNKKPNMGFMKPDGWHKLTHRTASDYRIGNLFVGEDAKALYKTLTAAVNNIKNMPCKYITYPNQETNSSQPVFEVANKTVKAKDSLFLDLQTLEQWGEFSLPESTWLAFNRYACWIEPVLVSEWVKTMASYTGNSGYQTPEKQYYLHQALNWLEPVRTTTEVRKRFEQIKQSSPEIAQCVWSAKLLKNKYDIDHSMPFARWPNNDLWNLLPTDSVINNQKSDRLPSEHKLKQSKERIQHWWQQAWLNNEVNSESKTKIITDTPATVTRNEVNDMSAGYVISKQLFTAPVEAKQTTANTQIKRFFAEANLALPGLNSDNESLDDLFEALVMQRGRLKEMQQLREW